MIESCFLYKKKRITRDGRRINTVKCLNKTLLGFLVTIARLGVRFRQKIPEHILPYLFDPCLVVSNQVGKTKAKRVPKKYLKVSNYIFSKREA